MRMTNSFTWTGKLKNRQRKDKAKSFLISRFFVLCADAMFFLFIILRAGSEMILLHFN